jgi:hypothetical protein
MDSPAALANRIPEAPQKWIRNSPSAADRETARWPRTAAEWPVFRVHIKLCEIFYPMSAKRINKKRRTDDVTSGLAKVNVSQTIQLGLDGMKL